MGVFRCGLCFMIPESVKFVSHFRGGVSAEAFRTFTVTLYSLSAAMTKVQYSLFQRH